MRSRTCVCNAVIDLIGTATILVVLHVGEASAQILPTFGNPVVYPVGDDPTTIRTADLDGDGNLDLLIVNSANGGDGSISVLLGKGDGTFGERTDRPAGSQPYGLAVAEITGDRRLDLIATSTNSDAVSIFRGLPRGRFGAPSGSYPTGDLPLQVVVGDFDRDGWLDFAVTNFRSNTVSVFRAKGHGQFLNSVDYPTRDGPASIVSTDLNGDRIPDLIVGNLYTDYTVYASPLSVFLGRGDGTFAPGTTTYVGRGPEEIAAADFNEDGRMDLTAVNFESRTLTVLLGNGSGGFVAKEEYPTGDLPLGLAVADFNADDHPDVAVTNHQENTISVFAGKGDGTFAQRVDYPAGGGFFLDPSRIVAGDFNGDAVPDLAVTNSVSNTISVLLNQGIAGRSAARDPSRQGGRLASTLGTEGIVMLSPNPVRSGSAAEISYSVSGEGAPVRICIYSVQGALVRRLELGYQPAGDHIDHWNGLGDSLERVSAGIYFVRMSLGNRSATARLLVIP